jgi:membrane protease YdiL (CAAX protease family)
VNRGNATATLLASGAFAVAVWLALPRPVRWDFWALGATLGVAACLVGFHAAARSRGPIPSRTPSHRLKLGVLPISLGAVLGAALLGLLVFLAGSEPVLRARFAGRLEEPLLRPWALAFESSILEEIVFRLLVFSVVAWLVLVLSRGRESGRWSFWVGLLASSLFFGLAHVPAWAAAGAATGPVIAVVLALNGLGGLLFGFVFWRWGLSYAILSHFAADVVVQALGPRLLT